MTAEERPAKMSMTLAGQSLKRHIENQDVSAVVNLIKAGSISLDERDGVSNLHQVSFVI